MRRLRFGASIAQVPVPPAHAILKAARLTPSFAYHGEGPFWDERRGRLLCMDVFGARIAEVHRDGTVRLHSVPTSAVTMVRRRVESSFIIATERGIGFVDDNFSNFERFVDLVDDPTVRTNDGGCDPLGNFVVGTMGDDARPGAGTVYSVRPNGRVTEILAPVTISNGLQWSAAGDLAFYVDTPTSRVDVFDVDSAGLWSGRRVHIAVDKAQGFPDGMSIDEDGGLWIAMWGGGSVNHYDCAGNLVEMVRVPGVTQVSSCCFGGHDRSVLFITTSREGIPDGVEPDAGAVFYVQTTVRGAVLREFAG